MRGSAYDEAACGADVSADDYAAWVRAAPVAAAAPDPGYSRGKQYAYASCTTQPTVPGPSALPVIIPWDIFLSTDTAVFDMPGGTGSTALQCKLPGSYWFEIKALFIDPPEGVAAVFEGSIVSSVDGSDGICLSMKKLAEMFGLENNQEAREMLGDAIVKICHRTGKTISIRDW